MILYGWAIAHGVSLGAIKDLERRIGLAVPSEVDRLELADVDSMEAMVQNNVRLAAANAGIRAFRNNVGALKDSTGRLVRYGAFNDSKRLNKVLKSSDLLGCRSVLITPGMVGSKIGQFWARECKHPTWHYSATEEEIAQKAFIDMINGMGGDAAFTNGQDL